MKTNYDDLARVILELGSKEFPSVDQEIVEKILQVEMDFSENRDEAVKRIQREVERFLDSHEGEK